MTEQPSSILVVSDPMLALPQIGRTAGFCFFVFTMWVSIANFAFGHFAVSHEGPAPISIVFARDASFVPPNSSVSLIRDVLTGVAAGATNSAYFVVVLSVRRWNRRRMWYSIAGAVLATVSTLFWLYWSLVQWTDFALFLTDRYMLEEPALGAFETTGLILGPLTGILVVQTTIVWVSLRRTALSAPSYDSADLKRQSFQ